MALQFSIEVDDKGTPKVKKFNKNLDKSKSAADKAGAALVGTSSAILALGTAGAVAGQQLFSMVSATTQNAQEIDNLSKVSNVGTEEFQKLAYGAKTVGIESDKLADIYKDVNDRIGDFAKTGGGPMKDFFEQIGPLVGVTIDDFKELSGPKALQLFQSSLEKANVSQQEMTFYLESMASDTTNLIPLLAEGGAGFNELGSQAERAGTIMSEDLIKSSKEFQLGLGQLEGTAQGVFNELSEDLIPTFITGMEEITAAVEFAGPVIVDIFKSIQPIIANTITLLSDTAIGWAQIAKEVNNALSLTEEFDEAASKSSNKEIEALEKRMKTQKQINAEERQAKEIQKKEEQQAAQREMARQKAISENRKKRNAEAKKAAEEQIKINVAKAEAILEQEEKIEEALKESAEFYAQLSEENKTQKIEAEKEITFNLMSEEEQRQAILLKNHEERLALLGETASVQRLYAQEQAQLELEASERRKESLIQNFENIGQITSSFSQALNNITAADQNNINRDYDEREARIKKEYDLKIKSAQGNSAEVEKLAKERDEKLSSLDLKREDALQKSAKKTATLRKRAAQLEAIVNTAAAVTKALPNFLLAGAVGLAGATQVAAIESAQFFAGGDTGPTQRNISVGENGREFVVSGSGTRAAGNEALEDLNNGRIEDAANRLLGDRGGSRQVNLNINGGVIDEVFLNNTLIPKLQEWERLQ